MMNWQENCFAFFWLYFDDGNYLINYEKDFNILFPVIQQRFLMKVEVVTAAQPS